MSKIFNRNFFVSCIFVLITLIFSCTNITTPKKIKIQTDPEINVSLGKIEASLTDYLSVEKIRELIGKDDFFSIYDYKHDKNDDTLRFLAQIDQAMEIPGIDVEEYLKNFEVMDPISFGYEEDGVTPSVMFSIPEIEQTIKMDPISLEFTNNITSSIKDFSAISFKGVQPGMIQNLQNQNIPYPIELCDDEFDSVTFEENTSLEIGFNQITDTNITTAKINKISIYKAQDILGMSIKEFKESGNTLDITKLLSINLENPIASTTIETDLISGKNLSSYLDLSNVTLPKDICLVLTVSFEGGNSNSSVEISTTKAQFSNVSFKKISGFNTKSPIVVNFPSINDINIGSSIEGFKGATIGSDSSDGEIIFSFDNLPSGIKPTTTLNFTQADTEYNSQTYQGLNLTNKTVENGKISLAGQSLNTNPISISGSLQIEANDAEIDFTEKLEISTGIQIKKFESIAISDSIIPQDVFTQTFSYPLGDIAEYVNKITFNEVGLALKLCNGLPFSATMNISSNFLGFNGKSYNFEANQTALPDEATKITSGKPENPLVINIDKSTELDLSIDLSLASSNGVITIPNVTTGIDYKFYGQAELIIDWHSVNFILPEDSSGFKGSFPGEDDEPIDLSALSSILGEDITLSGIKPNLYLSSPLLQEDGPLSGAEIKAVIKTSYTKDEKVVTDYIIGSELIGDVLSVVDMPTLSPDENFQVIGNLPTPSLELSGLTDVLLSGAKDLKIDYEIKLSGKTDSGDLSTGIEIKKSSLENLSESSEIKIGILLDLPIILTVKPNEKGYASFDIMSLMQNMEEITEDEENETSNETSAAETDLLGREPGGEIENLTTVFEFIENASIILKYTNNTGLALNLIIEDINSENQKFSKTVKLGKGKGSIELKFDEKDAQYIQNTNPFYPDKLELQIPGNKEKNTDYKFSRNATLDVTLQGSVKTDIDYTIDLANTETEGEF